MTRATQGWINYEDIIARADVMLRDMAVMSLGHQTMRRWAEEANREFSRISESVRDELLTVLIPNQQEYQLPADVLRVDLVSVLYPGESSDWLLVPYTLKEAIEEGYLADSGRPSRWYLSHDRRKVGLVFVPDTGGVESETTSTAGDTFTLVDTGLSSTDDAYNGLELKILSGDQAGEQQTISDYDAATFTVTVDTAFSEAIQSGVEYQIHPDSMKIRYSKMGNSYRIQPTTATIQGPAGNITRSLIELDLPVRPNNFYTGCEVRITSGDLEGEVARIISDDQSKSTKVFVTVEPAFHTTPAGSVTVVVTDVPNIPPAFHHALIDYVVYLALDRAQHPQALTHLARFREMAGKSQEADHPEQGQVFHRVRETRWGDEGWD